MDESAEIAQPNAQATATSMNHGAPTIHPNARLRRPLNAKIAIALGARPNLSDTAPPMTGPTEPNASAIPPTVAASAAALATS